jgi:protein-disulfide isomerase
MTKARSRAQFVFRPAVAVAGLSVLAVIILSALHEVSAPGVIARETAQPHSRVATTAQPDQAASDISSPAMEETEADREADAASDGETAEVKVAETSSGSAAAEGDAAPRFKDIVLGDADAPVTVIEYSSMTCSHCASFHADTLPKLKEQYIETGKVKFIMRAFPLDNLAGAASMLARCVAEDKYYPFVDMLFEKQSQWARADDPVKELRQVSKLAGFTEERFNKCVTDQEALEYIQQVRAQGDQKYDIRATPTLIINGQKLEGAQPIERLQAIIDPLLEDAQKS